MLFRECAGGVVFYEDRVFLMKNEKGEWVLPKGKIRNGKLSSETALERVKIETDIDAQIVSSLGETSYEFFSLTRKSPVTNKIDWYIMQAQDGHFALNQTLQYSDGGYYPIEEALEKATYSPDKGLISIAYRRYKSHQ